MNGWKSYQRPCIDCAGPRHKEADNGRCSACYWKWRRANSPYTGMTVAEYDAQRYDPAARRDKFLRDKHGITLEDYARLWANQRGRCAICDLHENVAMTTHTKLVVDHNHDTGEVRGLLCDLCNKGLGQFKDDQTRVEAAARYLKEFNDGRMDGRVALVVGDVRNH